MSGFWLCSAFWPFRDCIDATVFWQLGRPIDLQKEILSRSPCEFNKDMFDMVEDGCRLCHWLSSGTNTTGEFLTSGCAFRSGFMVKGTDRSCSLFPTFPSFALPRSTLALGMVPPCTLPPSILPPFPLALPAIALTTFSNPSSADDSCEDSC